jgi:hypothetical protein
MNLITCNVTSIPFILKSHTLIRMVGQLGDSFPSSKFCPLASATVFMLWAKERRLRGVWLRGDLGESDLEENNNFHNNDKWVDCKEISSCVTLVNLLNLPVPQFCRLYGRGSQQCSSTGHCEKERNSPARPQGQVTVGLRLGAAPHGAQGREEGLVAGLGLVQLGDLGEGLRQWEIALDGYCQKARNG